MKKFLYLVVTMFVLLPLSIKAQTASISSASLDGTNNATVGKEFSESVYVKFSNVKKGTADTYGVYLVAYEIEYDESIFTIEDVTNDGDVFKSTVYKEDGKTYIISYFNKDPFHNACVDDTLYCADYYVTIKFYVKDTDKKNTTINIKDVGAGVFKVDGGVNPTYELDNIIELEYSSNISKTINIEKLANVEVREVKSVVSSSKPSAKKPTTPNVTVNNEVKKESSKSNNNNIKSLDVKNYTFSFSKEKLDYDLTVESEVNKLELNVILEDSNATYEIIGADDLKANDYKVLIKVKAQNGEEKNYTINIKHLNKESDIVSSKKESYSKINKDIKKMAIIGSALLLIFIISGIVYNIVSNKKIDRKLDF